MTAWREYRPDAVEARWQRFWQERGIFKTRRNGGEKFYCYNPAPYVTGSLHMGHVRNYTYGDFVSRYKRMRGADVLYTIGFDAFGVPTEMAAIRHGIAPAEWAERCVAAMKDQMCRMGLSFDWDRSFATSDPGYYRWTQWLFIEMLRDGIVYPRDAVTLWCPTCALALARSLTEEGACSICGSGVEERVTAQWFLRLTRYLDRLRGDLDTISDANGQARAGQDSLLAVRSLPAVRLLLRGGAIEVIACMESATAWCGDLNLAVHPDDWHTRQRLGVERTAGSELREVSDLRAVEPETSREFRVVIDPTLDPLFEDQPVLRPAPPHEGQEAAHPMPRGGFPARLVYEQKDFSITRQRVWGTPVPVVHCASCGPVPVVSSDLPVLMPEVRLDTAGLPRRAEPTRAFPCPACGRPATPDPQVMDCHFDALWHYCWPCKTPGNGIPFGNAGYRDWMPVDLIQFGRDTIPFLLTMRMLTMFLHDRGLSDVSEFARATLAHGLILRNNQKMSKHLGNVVEPSEVISRYGADSLRFYVLARNDPKSDYDWSESSIAHYHGLLRDFHDDMADATAGPEHAGAPERGAPNGKGSKYLTIFLSKALRDVAVLERSIEQGRYDVYARAVAGLLTSLHVYKSRHYDGAAPSGRSAWALCNGLAAAYLAPIAPHLAEECRELLGIDRSWFEGATWPRDGADAIRRLLESTKEGKSGEPGIRVRAAR